ncbi:hypothetical protein [Methanosphaera sp.]|uniref:hypothetical protein n=1 Tax=Methanosphaera sp. TaxID=2666342 RepID=UPI0025F97BF3|nr:hypothetical protein [Methanosphaera sp.]
MSAILNATGSSSVKIVPSAFLSVTSTVILSNTLMSLIGRISIISTASTLFISRFILLSGYDVKYVYFIVLFPLVVNE